MNFFTRIADKTLLVLFGVIAMGSFQGQIRKDTLQKSITLQDDKKISFNALLVADYGVSLTDRVDVQGKQSSTGNYSSNGFYLRYARLQAKLDLNKDISGQILVNFADFKDNPQTKVLEIAAVKYHFNDYLNLQAGQFRPYFGAEDLYPAEMNRSYYWSNQYSLFSKSNWESFQLGIAVFGSLQKDKIPLKYYYTYYNGNGKNQNGDNDNAKTHSFRAEYGIGKNLIIAGNAAFTRHDSQSAQAFGGDITYEKQLNKNWFLAFNSEYKKGSNISEYDSSAALGKSLNDFQMQGIYFIPMVRRSINTKLFNALELSCRYEYLENLAKNGNPVRIYTPMISLVSGNTYTTKLSLIGVLQDYNRNVPNTTQWSSNQILLQFQFKY